jgi:hypothetical protein
MKYDELAFVNQQLAAMLREGISQTRALINYQVAFGLVLNPLMVFLQPVIFTTVLPVMKDIATGLHIAPGLPWVLGISFAGLAAVLAQSNTGPEVVFPVAVIFVGSLAFCNFYFTGSAINELRDGFRPWAARS